MAQFFLKIFALFFTIFAPLRAENLCLQTDTEKGPFCVCKASHCDTIPPLLALAKGQFQLYTSSKKKLGFSSNFGNFSLKNPPTNSLKISLKLAKKRQTILGFGGAFTDATGINIASLTNRTRDLLLENYFGQSGVEYSVGRVPIGGTDFSRKGYTYCDERDETLQSFALQREDFEFKLPFLRRAIELRGKENLKLFASAWSAPIWMKNTDKYNGFGKIEEKYYELWAEYYLKFFDAYDSENVTFWGVTTQNEPVDGLIGTAVQNNGFNAKEMKKWIKEALGPAIRNSTKYNHLKIILHDDQRVLLPLLKWLILSDEKVVEYADGVGVHFYTDFFTPASFLNFASVEGKSLFRLATEGCTGSTQAFGFGKAVELGSWSRAESYLSSIFSDLNHDVIGWIDWNMALNTSGGPNWIRNEVDSPIVVDPLKDEFYKQPMFYALGHFSKFVPPGSIRIENQIDIDGGSIEALSFLRPDERIVVVLWNKSDKEKSVTVKVENLTGNLNLTAKSINSLLIGL